ncbi:restriction endonuclease subunit S [Polaribacter sp. SA4-12]|uniref:restriction endonuclease subunit S n=1 Tax=Polaribacter sp. SA4-12 TaxID=1312072 RepID=UPI000B3C4AC2|nr:restriction endonuclease subunit S [Polaribacter sp. SA4-12]ARV16635.1 hypothetical protein BTO07_16485 [Polaribacter sp. SA4-12]
MNSFLDKTTLGEVSDFIGGSQPPKKIFSNIKKEGYIRLIQIRDYKKDSFITYIPKNSTRKFCKKDDIMIGRYGPPIFQILRGIEGAYNVALIKAIPKNNIENDYLYYFLCQKHLFEYINALSPRTGGQTGVDVVMLKKFPIKLPELYLQKRIAHILSSLDSKITINNKINQQLEAMSKALYEYWFVQFDFPNSNGKPYKSSGGIMVYNNELKRKIPKNWEVIVLNDLVDNISSTINSEEIDPKTPYVGLEHIPRKSIVLSEWETAKKVNSSKNMFKKYDILFGKIRPYFHKVGIAFVNGITSTDTIVLRPKNKNYAGIALETVFTDIFIETATKSSTGTKMPRANWNILKDYALPICKGKILSDFQSVLNPIILKLESNVKQNKKLSELRDWLLPMLMNGQVSVGSSSLRGTKQSYNESTKNTLGLVAEENAKYGEG